jgi:uncharacterized alpha-E superfamily protein
MLSRVADAMFWMSRYLERAEHIARLLDVSFHHELDLHDLMAQMHEVHWKSQLTILQQSVPEHLWTTEDPPKAISQWLAFDMENSGSILSSVNRSRNNARSVRGTISSEMWRALNQLYWKLRDVDFVSRAKESPYDYYQAVEAGNHLFHGVCDATMPHDEGWQFIQLGKYLERAEKTIRILDVKYQQLAVMTDVADLPLLNLEWAGVLKSCLAYESFQRLYIGRVESENVIEFILLNPIFPRSIRFCLEEVAKALGAIEGEMRVRREDKVERMIGRILGELRYVDLPQLLSSDFHAFMVGLLQRLHLVSRAMQEQYTLVN